MLFYYKAYCQGLLGLDFEETLAQAENSPRDYCFPNKLEDLVVLGQLHQGRGVLAGHLALAALPGVEAVGHDEVIGLLIPAQQVQQGGVFDLQIVPLQEPGLL